VDATAVAAAVTGPAFFAAAFARDLRAVFAALVRLLPDAFLARFAPPFLILFAIDPPFLHIAWRVVVDENST